MSAEILSGKAVSTYILDRVAEESRFLRENGVIPRLAVLRAGSDVGSISYEKSIAKIMSSCGIAVESIVFGDDVTPEEFFGKLTELNGNKDIHSILVFRPLPSVIDEDIVRNSIDPAKDADGMNPVNLGKLIAGDKSGYAPCTAEGVMKFLEYYGEDIKSKDVVIINRSDVIGKPLALMMTNGHATVTVCHSKTKDVKRHTRTADIVISAVGKYGFITPDMLGDDAVLIDIAVTHMTDEDGNIIKDENGGSVLCGDAHADCCEKVKIITSATPSLGGGTGPVTTAVLAQHVVRAAKIAGRPH